MTDTKKLRAKMLENDYTLKKLSKAIDLSVTGLFNKVHNKREFTQCEIQKIANLLKLSTKDKEEIFFAQDVDL